MSDGAVSVERPGDETAVVVVRGDTLGFAAESLTGAVESVIASGIPGIVVDFSALEVLNSKLLDGLVRASRTLPPDAGAIVVVSAQGYIGHMLEISETGGIVLLADTRDEALEILSSL